MTTNPTVFTAWLLDNGERDQRPTGPDTPIRRRLHGDLTADTLEHILDELRADPTWIVLPPFERPPERLIQIVYRPTGTPYCFRAVPVKGGWQFVAET
jgi:hypothetical protein